MRILVTGGAGYIGSHACCELAAAGHLPVTFDNLSRGHRAAVRWGPLVEADLRDPGAIDAALREFSIDAVIHFAALAYVGESMAEPGRYFSNNVAGSLALLDAMHAAGVRKLVFSSTCATYGLPQAIPITEDHPQQPVNPYGESKLFIERAIAWHAQAHGLQWMALRYFNAAGADPQGRIGEDHEPETHLIPLAIETALGRRTELQVMGNDYPTADGTAVRDYVHVSDLARAHLLALDDLHRGGASMALNLGTGTGFSVRQVVAAVERLSGQAVRTREMGRRAGDPPALVAAPARAADILGWRPSRSGLDEIVRTALAWHVARAQRDACGAGAPSASIAQEHEEVRP
ncbi:UDP-glucose 4-epimerase GalE [Piscinibacter sakaiensis]|uniref:UDP-glucose 4-epimerase GalE n=1 Tax=Piscinibacter sakaiensis TaxID=1547922 RepID=UPI003AABF080